MSRTRTIALEACARPSTALPESGDHHPSEEVEESEPYDDESFESPDPIRAELSPAPEEASSIDVPSANVAFKEEPSGRVEPSTAGISLPMREGTCAAGPAAERREAPTNRRNMSCAASGWSYGTCGEFREGSAFGPRNLTLSKRMRQTAPCDSRRGS